MVSEKTPQFGKWGHPQGVDHHNLSENSREKKSPARLRLADTSEENNVVA